MLNTITIPCRNLSYIHRIGVSDGNVNPVLGSRLGLFSIKKILPRLVVIVLSCMLIGGCSYFKKGGADLENAPAEVLYQKAKESMAKKNWQTAIEQLRALEGKYPYGVYAEQARIDTIYAYYRSEQTGLALAAADRFIKLHPTHSSVDYAYYLKGLASFSEDDSLLGRIMGRDDLSDRDATSIYNAMIAFEEVYTLFPSSQYTPDSIKRAEHLLEALAKNEIAVANYYYSRGAYVAVVNRAKGVIENYNTTASVEQALALMMFSYEQMGFDDLSNDAYRVLELNFPASEYLAMEMTDAVFANKYSPDADKKKKNKRGWFSSLRNRLKKEDSPSS